MQKSLTLDEYVACFVEIDNAWTVFIIKQYFKGDVDAFYKAPSKFKEWSAEKDFYKRKTLFKPAWDGIMAYNFAAINCKYLRNIFGKNYNNAAFMDQARKRLEALGYKKVNRGTLTYKGEKHPFCAKYLPPKEKIEEIFKSQQMVDIVVSPSSYCNKVGKILTAMKEEHLPEELKKKIQNKSTKVAHGPAATPVKVAEPVKSPAQIFQTPYELLDAVKALLDTGAVGGPSAFKSALRPILTDYLLKDLDQYWNAKPFAVREQFNYVNWLTELPIEDKIAVYKARFDFLSKVFKQLNSDTDASKMFKDEYDSGKFAPADEKRICNARVAVRKALLGIRDAAKLARMTAVAVADND